MEIGIAIAVREMRGFGHAHYASNSGAYIAKLRFSEGFLLAISS
jgi:hypothetical protein